MASGRSLFALSSAAVAINSAKFHQLAPLLSRRADNFAHQNMQSFFADNRDADGDACSDRIKAWAGL